MSKKSVLVFGAAGFIGTYLTAELLKRKYRVVAADISRIGGRHYRKIGIPYVAVDITEPDRFRRLGKARFDAVIHLAAMQPANVSARSYDPRAYININVIGTLNILEFCRANGVKKIIYASSHRNTQGLWVKKRAIREADGRAQKHRGEYAIFSISESAAQDCVEHYRAQYGLQAIILRLPPVYGYGPHSEIFKDGKPIKTGFQTFIDRAIAGQPLEIWGDSSVGRDIVYVKDVVSAFLKALENDKAQGLFNITSGTSLTIREQAETTAKVFWGDNRTKPRIVELPDTPHDMDSFLYDNSKARRELGWTPRYDFRAMLQDIKREMSDKRFAHLVRKRQQLLKADQPTPNRTSR